MQPDQPLYDEMVRRGSRGRWFWLTGGWLRLAGICGIVLALVLWPAALYFRIGDFGFYFALGLFVSAGLFTLGTFLKRISYKLALKEGLDITAYFEKEGGR